MMASTGSTSSSGTALRSVLMSSRSLATRNISHTVSSQLNQEPRGKPCECELVVEVVGLHLRVVGGLSLTAVEKSSYWLRSCSPLMALCSSLLS
jgi:hypothetical protein